jgi:hypothetical protein
MRFRALLAAAELLAGSTSFAVSRLFRYTRPAPKNENDMDSNPYAPPKSNVVKASEEGTEYEFRDLSKLSRNLSILLLIGLVGEILTLTSAGMQLSLLTRASYTEEEAFANDARERLVSGMVMLLYWVTAIVYARWLFLAHRNLPALGAENLRFRPGWALGWFFIPLANLWKPCQAMSDLMRASKDPRHWHLDETPPLVISWWILWLVVSNGGNAVLRMTLRSDSLETLRLATTMEIVLTVLSIPLYLLARQIVVRVWRDQSQTVQTRYDEAAAATLPS